MQMIYKSAIIILLLIFILHSFQQTIFLSIRQSILYFTQLIMPQHEYTYINPQTIENKNQSLQLNRLMKFIQNKRTPSFNKLKEMFSIKQSPFNEHLSSNNIKSQHLQQNQRDSITVHTKNIFVGRNKTEVTSPRQDSLINKDGNQYYKIFITKEQILKLHNKEKHAVYPWSINMQNNSKSNLFPPLVLPKPKRPVALQRYEDETTKWLNSDLKIPNTAKNQNKLFNLQRQEKQQTQIDSSKEQLKPSKALQNLHLQRQQYNKSLQKLIEKAFKNKYKQHKQKNLMKSKAISIDQKKQFDERKSIESEMNQQNLESIYASKGKLISNPHLKIKKDTRFKQKNELLQKINSPRHQQKGKGRKNSPKFNNHNAFIEVYQNGKKNLPITNREQTLKIHENTSSTMKLRTEGIVGKTSQYELKSIKKQNKTLKLINQLQSSILKRNAKDLNILESRKLEKLLDHSNLQLLNMINDPNAKLIDSSSYSHDHGTMKSHNKRSNIKSLKTKTLQSQQLPSINKKSVSNWQIGGYDFENQIIQSNQQNLDLQKYVRKMMGDDDQKDISEQPS